MGLEGMWTGFAASMFHQVAMYMYLIHKTDWRQASKEALKRIKFEAKNGSRSSLRMANDLSAPISRSYSDQSSFASLTSDSGSVDE